MTDQHKDAAGSRWRDLEVDLAELVQLMSLPTWVFDTETLDFLEVNAAAARRYGYSRDELLRMTIKDIRPPAEVPRLLAHLARRAGDRTPITSLWRHRRKDGVAFMSEVTSFHAAFAGRAARVVTSFDVTQRERAEALVRYQTFLLSTISDAIVATDAGSIVTGWNAAAERLYGCSAAEVLGRAIDDVIREQPGDGGRSTAMQQLVATGRFCGEVTHVARSGEHIRVEAHAVALTDPGGARSGFVCVHRDIAERRRVEDHVRALLGHVVHAQEEERRRVARELHDDAAQAMASLLVGLRTAESADTLDRARREVVALRTEVARALDAIERIARGLRPAALDDLGLEAALERMGNEVAEAHGFKVAVAIDLEGRRLAPPLETTLYRIAQEALTNVGKHAGATTVSIVLRRAPGRIQLIVDDDGQGFDVEAAVAGRHFGLQGMRERAALVGGRLSVETGPGKGTSIYVCVPDGGIA